MNKKYAIIGLLILMVLGLGCIGNNSANTNTPGTKSQDISSRLAESEKSGIFSEMMKTANNRCANKYLATFNDGDYLEIQWDNHNSPCENNLSSIYYSIDYISGNDSYKLSYNSGVKGSSAFTDFSNEVVKKYNSGELSNQDKEIYADFNNVSDIGKFVIKISGTDGVRFTGTINGMTEGYIPVKKLDDTIPMEISVDNLKSMSLKKLTIGLMKVDIMKDDKLIFSNYINNHNPNLEYSSNPGYLKEDMPS